MTTLAAIAYTLAAGAAISSVTIVAFGCAIRQQTPLLAPRATARPSSVIFDPQSSSISYRGNAWLGWIPWVMSLSYHSLLTGVEGTGTRDGGRSGPLLATNIDGIVLLRFHALGRKIALVATIWCIGLLLPLYYTSPCLTFDSIADDDKIRLYNCDRNVTVLSDYGQTTLSRVPVLHPNDHDIISIQPMVLVRLYAAVGVLWLLTLYIMHLLRQEWIELLAIRRIYYLEANIDQERRRLFQKQVAEEDSSLDDREPWIPHPEQPDTPASIELYSVLMGNLPVLPSTSSPTYTRDNIDWQLTLATTFLEQMAPPTPGFTSSVAAVTILPGAASVGEAWRKWYAAASQLRRLRFIRKLVLQRQGDEEAAVTDSDLADGPSDANVKKVLGTIVVDPEDNVAYQAQHFGPEQTAVYAREFAQAAAPCCPKGMREGRVKKASLEELLDLEEEAVAEVRRANKELEEVRHQVICKLRPSVLHSHTVSLPSASELPSSLQLEGHLTAMATSSVSQVASAHDSRHDVEDDDDDVDEDERWKDVQALVSESRSAGILMDRSLPSGIWRLPRCKGLINHLFGERRRRWFLKECPEKALSPFAEESAFAVVTFTTRKAAAAARQCLADGRGVGRWLQPRDMPVPPLADAAACDILLCRNCCRPVTLTISDRRKNFRLATAVVVLALIYVFYVVPLTYASSLVDPDILASLMPGLVKLSKEIGINLIETISGLLSSLIWSCFFMLCPQMFKWVANYGSRATSVAQAELRALEFFWWFMVFTAFSGTLLASGFISAVQNGFDFRTQFRQVLIKIAERLPTSISATWLHWILFRFTITIPLNYLLQINTFIFTFLRMPCCARVTIGGGPGGPVPYRIFVDSGVVIMCVVALAPSCPLVAPASLAYFLVFEPLLRRNLIFVYRPKYNDGGQRFVFLFKMMISLLVVGQLLLMTQMIIKNAVAPAILTFLAVPVTIIFRSHCAYQYGRPYQQGGLLQSSLLDRRLDRPAHLAFLRDAHRAAYIPVCIAGGDHYRTVEPAQVVDGDETVVDVEEDASLANDSGCMPAQNGGRDKVE